jgi:hypothetical protein
LAGLAHTAARRWTGMKGRSDRRMKMHEEDEGVGGHILPLSRDRSRDMGPFREHIPGPMKEQG